MDDANELIRIPDDLQEVVQTLASGGGPGVCNQCEGSCENSCMRCQASCQSTCEKYCQSSQGCMATCETSAQNPTTAGSISVDKKNSGSTYATIIITAIPRATSYEIHYRPNDTSETDSIQTSSLTVKISGLLPNKLYFFNYFGLNEYGTGPFTQAAEYTTKGLVEPWDWGKQNVNASAELTKKAYNALISHGPTTDFSYLVWNDMVDKANEVVRARNHTWNTDYCTIDATKATSTDKNITASRVNSVWWNMRQFIKTGLSKKNPGDAITGQYFINLAAAINKAIP